jgi:ATP-grasp in the biosynthetic pathway with Ter operon
MQRVWFNKTFSSVYAVISLIREADRASRYQMGLLEINPRMSGRIGMVCIAGLNLP